MLETEAEFDALFDEAEFDVRPVATSTKAAGTA